jgi:GGDEF domain-containing protein
VVQRVDALIAGRNANQMLDELTKLAGPKHIKLDVQRAIHLKSRFSIAYIEMMNLIPFGRSLGNDARIKAIKDMAHGLTVIGKKLNTKMFKVAHMGGGHYVCILEPSMAVEYCNLIVNNWAMYLPRLYESVGHKWVYNPDTKKDGPGNLPLLETMACITSYDPGHPATALQVFDTLTSLRKKALEENKRGVVVDLRQDKIRSQV